MPSQDHTISIATRRTHRLSLSQIRTFHKRKYQTENLRGAEIRQQNQGRAEKSD
jgi:hypothetical protein